MKVSLITVCLNSAHIIGEVIDSVSRQTHYDIEHIFVDGGSTDVSVKILESRCCNYISEKDYGIYDALNKGILRSTGDVVGILHCGDFFRNKEIVNQVVEHFAVYPEIDFLIGSVEYFYRNKDVPVRSINSRYFRPWHLYFGLMPAHPGFFARREILFDVGLYDRTYSSAGDFEFFIRLFLKNRYSYHLTDEVFTRMSLGGVSSSGIKSILRTTFEQVRALRENRVFCSSLLVSLRIPLKVFTVCLFFLTRKRLETEG